jgi:hypothetical protein
MRHKNLIQIPFRSASQAIYIIMCSMCLPLNIFNIGFNPCCRKGLPLWEQSSKTDPVLWKFLMRFEIVCLSGPTLTPNFTWNTLLTFSGLSDDRMYSSMMEYPLLGTVQNWKKTNDKQMAWALQCVSKVSSNYNHSLWRKLSLNLVGTFWTTLYLHVHDCMIFLWNQKS